MKTRLNQIIFFMFLILYIQACSVKQSDIKSVVQTNSATQIEEFKTEILKDLIVYKKKLDLRNPNAYNKELQASIIYQTSLKQDYLNLIQNGKTLENYNEYFYYAFSSENITNRNDLLILGLYKLMFKAFSMEKNHQFTAIEYNKQEMLKLYEYLQVVRWKIKTAKDTKGEYLFKTWQNNWQLELAKKYEGDFNIINDLTYIKENKESIFDPSNFSFEIILSKIIVNVEYTLRKINVEPYEMGVSALKGFMFIL